MSPTDARLIVVRKVVDQLWTSSSSDGDSWAALERALIDILKAKKKLTRPERWQDYDVGGLVARAEARHAARGKPVGASPQVSKGPARAAPPAADNVIILTRALVVRMRKRRASS